MKTIKLKLHEFAELNEDAKDKAVHLVLNDWLAERDIRLRERRDVRAVKVVRRADAP